MHNSFSKSYAVYAEPSPDFDNWNQSVGKEDQVFFLGDFGLGDVDQLHSICSHLNGQKICIRGNHDRNASWMTRVGFNVVLKSAFLKIGRHLVELIHIPSEQAPAYFQLHGHVYDKRPRKIISNQLNLCVGDRIILQLRRPDPDH